MADLKVTVGADAAEYNRVIGNLGTTAKKGSDEAAKVIDANMKRISTSIATSGGSIAKGSDKAAFALTNLSRVAQDAPFGFIGIQNNINPLLESFQGLVKETGSVKGAFSALLSSLTGPAGLGLAIGVITAGITAYTMWQQRAGSETDKVKDKTKSYVDTLDSVRQAQLKGQQEGQNEIVRLQILYNATQNASLSMKQRSDAYDELNSKYPKTFSNNDKEVTLLGQNVIAYDNLKVAILAAASAKAYEQKIGENSNRQFENEQKLIDLRSEQVKITNELTKAQITAKAASSGLSGNTQSSMTGGGGQANSALIAVAAVQAAQDKLNENIKKQNNLRTDSNKLLKQNKDLIELASASEIKAGFKDGGEFDDSVKKDPKPKKIKEGFSALEKQITDNNTEIEKAQLSGNDTLAKNLQDKTRILENNLAELKKVYDDLSMLAGRNPLNNFTPLSISGDEGKGYGVGNTFQKPLIDPQSAENISGLESYRKLAQERLNSANSAKVHTEETKKENEQLKFLTGTIGTGLTSAFESALSGTQNFFTAFGQILLQLIEKIAAAALAALALSAVLAIFTGGSSLLAGAGASSSFGSLFSSFSGLPKFAEGGIVSQPTLGIFGEAGTEAVMPIEKLQNFVSNNGGGGNYQPAAQVIGGDLLITWMKQAEKSNKRRT